MPVKSRNYIGKAALGAGTLTAIARDQMAGKGYLAPNDRIFQAFRGELHYNNIKNPNTK